MKIEIKEYFSELGKKGWAHIDPVKRSEIMKIRGISGNKKRWKNTTKQQRIAHSIMMNEAKRKKYVTQTNNS